uniref:replication protein n=1 Tax=Planococcus sp. (in: firmicutes) TaxID=1871321 RepID=UPI00159ACAAB|nr:replication protein [Planococcus sp. (in: firmicutes)]QJS06172.1 replication protein [Planococcus sp. (in: firmicutes)]
MLQKKKQEILEIYETDMLTYLKQYFQHSKQKESYFFLCENKMSKDPAAEKKWIQKSYRVQQLDEMILDLMTTDRTDFYISTNVHSERKRSEETISSVPALVLDIDYYNTPFKNLDFEDFLKLLDDEVFEKEKIPRPNCFVSSGAGVYLVWFLKYTPCVALAKRNVMMKILYEMMKKYGADPKTLDGSHVFRFPGTYSGKNAQKVPVKAFLQNETTEYTLSGFARAVPSLYDVWKKDKPEKKEIEKKLSRGSKIKVIHKERTLAYDYIQNVFKLVELRNGECEGIREMMCFLVRNYYHTMHKNRFQDKDPELYQESLKLALELNQKFSKSLKENEIRSSTLNKTKLYKFKVETFNEWLGVTLEEELQLKLKSKRGTRERSKRKMREIRGSVPLEDYEKERKDNKEHLINMLQRYLKKNPKAKRKELADLLGVHPTYITKLKKEL